MKISTIQNNIHLLAKVRKENLAVASDGRLYDKQDESNTSQKTEQIGTATIHDTPSQEDEELKSAIQDTYDSYISMNRPLWVKISEKNGKLLGVKADLVFQKVFCGENFSPIEEKDLEEHEQVTFIVEGKAFTVDRTVASEHSEMFKKRFKGSVKEAGEDQIPLEGIKAQTFQTFIDFIEGREWNRSNDLNDYVDQWLLADQLSSSSLKEAALQEIMKRIKIKHLPSLLGYSEELFTSFISALPKNKAQELSEAIDKICSNNAEKSQLAMRTLVLFINKNQIPMVKIANYRTPSELIHWLGSTAADLEYADFTGYASVSGFGIANKDLQELTTNAPNLKHLLIPHSRISESALDVLEHCKNLQSLNILGCNQLNPNALDVLEHCPNLQSLNIEFCSQFKQNAFYSQFKPNALNVLKHCPNLKHLLMQTSKISGSALDVLEHCPNLQSLDISGCPQLNPNALDVLEHCPNLQSLNISGCDQFKPDALNVLEHCPNLQSLNLSGCIHLKEDALDVLEHCKNLQSLKIWDCGQFKQDALDVLEHCKNLQSLESGNLIQLKADALDVLKHCPNLQSLNIGGLSQLNPNALDVLEHCPNLKSLVITHCRQLREAAELLKKERPNIDLQDL